MEVKARDEEQTQKNKIRKSSSSEENASKRKKLDNDKKKINEESKKNNSKNDKDEQERKKKNYHTDLIRAVELLKVWDLKFTGEVDDTSDDHVAEEFFNRLEDCRKSSEINDNVFLNAVPSVLYKLAADWYRMNRSRFHSWKDLTKAFKKQFRKDYHDADIMASLIKRKQGEDEDITTFLTHFRCTVNKFQDKPSSKTLLETAYANLLLKYKNGIKFESVFTLNDLELYGKVWEKEKCISGCTPTSSVTKNEDINTTNLPLLNSIKIEPVDTYQEVNSEITKEPDEQTTSQILPSLSKIKKNQSFEEKMINAVPEIFEVEKKSIEEISDEQKALQQSLTQSFKESFNQLFATKQHCNVDNVKERQIDNNTDQKKDKPTDVDKKRKREELDNVQQQSSTKKFPIISLTRLNNSQNVNSQDSNQTKVSSSNSKIIQSTSESVNQLSSTSKDRCDIIYVKEKQNNEKINQKKEDQKDKLLDIDKRRKKGQMDDKRSHRRVVSFSINKDRIETNDNRKEQNTGWDCRLKKKDERKGNENLLSTTKGVLFGNLTKIPTHPELDPPFGSCFNCWEKGHLSKNCMKPINSMNYYCKNCGRKGVSVAECPRCRNEYRNYKIRDTSPCEFTCTNISPGRQTDLRSILKNGSSNYGGDDINTFREHMNNFSHQNSNHFSAFDFRQENFYPYEFDDYRNGRGNVQNERHYNDWNYN